MSTVFRGSLYELEEFEKKLAKKLVHVAERNYEEKTRREFAIFVLKQLAAMARECDNRKEDETLGRIGRPR